MGRGAAFSSRSLEEARVGRESTRTIFVALAIVAALAAALGFGMTPGDARRVSAFGEAVRRWQVNPDYRAVSAEYVTLGVEAMQARLCGVSAGHVIMAFRSIPGLPDHLAIGNTSAAHYDAFSRGRLSAYLHLASEQGLNDGINLVEALGRRSPVSDDEIVAFLAGFRLPVPTRTDGGAVAGVRRLLVDTHADKPFSIRTDLSAALGSHIGSDPERMSRIEQAAAFAGLDDAVRELDPQLWRAKQVNDFLAGIWAQGYGQIYLDGIDAFFHVRRAARVALALVLMSGAWLMVRERVKPAVTASATTA
jgi:hypothetical protein